jgi:hypothetical protein|nr:hypothetical protein [Actinophrys sol]
MLIKRHYLNLLNKFFYEDIFNLHKKLRVVCFINLSFRLDLKILINYQVYIYFFLSLFFGQIVSILKLKRDFARLSLEKGYPLGGKLHITKITFYTFVYYFTKWYYYNIFGELKLFFLEKKRGKFFGLKIPFINLFYLFDYNLITLFLYNLNIPNFKMFVSMTADKFETKALKNVFNFR